jgi:opacity protein-like surface antigen
MKSTFTLPPVFVLLLGSLGIHAEEPASKSYLSIEGGYSLQQSVTIKETGQKASFDPGLRIDLAIGTRSPKNVSVELDVGVIYNSMKKVNGEPLFSEDIKLDAFEIPLMLDFLYNFPKLGPVTIYAGGGIGAVWGIYTGNDTTIFGFGTDITFGYQGIAGINYALSDRCDLGVVYKFLGTTDHDMAAFKTDGTMTHCFLAKLTFKF